MRQLISQSIQHMSCYQTVWPLSGISFEKYSSFHLALSKRHALRIFIWHISSHTDCDILSCIYSDLFGQHLNSLLLMKLACVLDNRTDMRCDIALTYISTCLSTFFLIYLTYFLISIVSSVVSDIVSFFILWCSTYLICYSCDSCVEIRCRILSDTCSIWCIWRLSWHTFWFGMMFYLALFSTALSFTYFESLLWRHV